MFELLTVLAVLACVFVVVVTPWPSLLMAGAVTTAAGLVFGVATGFWYHVALWRTLLAKKTLPRRWWVKPVSLHGELDAVGRRHVMPWFYAGAVGFFVTVVGLALLAASMAFGLWGRS